MKLKCPKCNEEFDKDHTLIDHLMKKHPDVVVALRRKRR